MYGKIGCGIAVGYQGEDVRFVYEARRWEGRKRTRCQKGGRMSQSKFRETHDVGQGGVRLAEDRCVCSLEGETDRGEREMPTPTWCDLQNVQNPLRSSAKEVSVKVTTLRRCLKGDRLPGELPPLGSNELRHNCAARESHLGAR